MEEVLTLEPVLDLKAALQLRRALLEHRGRALRIDASAVQRLGGLCLQVLLSAKLSWAEDGALFCLSPRSQAFDDTVFLFGAVPALGETRLEHRVTECAS
jgi:chemotaxis protein CheX